MKTIGYIQYEPLFGDLAGNRARLDEQLNAIDRADLLVLPELALTGYDFIDAAEALSLAEPFADGPSSDWLRAHARRTGAAIVMGYAEAAPEGCYNSAMMALPDGSMANYRKLHLFSRENLVFLRGDASPKVYDTPGGRVGMMICFDWFFPEVARTLALAGAQILAHPSNLVLNFCQRAMFARCVENHVFAVTANRTGVEERAGNPLRFTGMSQILGVRGEALAQAPDAGPHTGLVQIDPAEADNKRINNFNDLFADRRIEMYALGMPLPRS